MGEPGGVGGELTLQAYRTPGIPPFLAIDDPDRLRAIDPTVPVRPVADAREAAAAFARALPVLPLGLDAPIRSGRADPAHAPKVIESVERAVALAGAGEVSAVVTNPIQKESLLEAGFPHAGHTEFLAALTGAPRGVMMLACPALRVVPLTVHVPLREVPSLVTDALIGETARITDAALRRHFGLAVPRLVLAGLNPHAGEGGRIGTEERAVMGPAVRRLRAEGLDIRGPLPADTLFHAEARSGYDVALCPYHDQALVAVKTLDFHGAVNVTLGLPIVRTSPDHGTALDIAGTGGARPDSLVAALRLAAVMAGG